MNTYERIAQLIYEAKMTPEEIDENIQKYKRLYKAGKKDPTNPKIAAAKKGAGDKYIRSLDKRVKERGQTPQGFAKASMEKEIAARNRRAQRDN